ncbi:unnamed protein product [Prorocentrum cordatum]|uniref:ABC transporter domain-containing protein n=1 Tax=Prorocentrum cordatum TaxID=2364126 RepID=A0ABN9V4B3_9DINO|nr:unnamed protein product [Polarella glacialis]
MLICVAVLQDDGDGRGSGGLGLAIYPPLAFGAACVSFTADLVHDRENRCKHVALSQGAPIRGYWVGNLLGHYPFLLPTSAILVLLVAVAQPAGLPRASVPLLAVEAAVYPVGLLLYAYNCSLWFESVEMASKILPICNMLLATLPTVCVQILGLIGRDPWPGVARVVHMTMSVVNPVYAMPGMLIQIPIAGYSDPSEADFFPSKGTPLCSAPLLLSSGEAARYEGLSHTYRFRVGREWREAPAVRGISLGVRAGECFGLLGPNGAGKTTTLALLTGEVRPPSAGSITVLGQDVSTPQGLAAARRLLGVCPQADPLWPTLTGRQHVAFYARVKGAEKYSGGMRRKLSLAIALVGRSPLLFLDEPTAAVDAGAKRHLWQIIRSVRGQLRCLGTPGHIKHRYGSGYQLELLCRPERAALVEGGSRSAPGCSRVEDFVRTRLSERAALIEQHGGRCLFQLPLMGVGSRLTLGTVFAELQGGADAAGIIDYSLVQPSLEQVFVRFAREQDEADAPDGDPAPLAPADSDGLLVGASAAGAL